MVTEIARHGASKTVNGRLGRGIGGKPAAGFPPGIGTHVDDRPPALFDHAVRHRLDGKKLVTQIGFHAVIPVLRGHRLPVMAIIVGRIVDQNISGPQLSCELGDRIL